MYLCICVFVFLYLCVWHMWISFLIPLNNPLFKNIPHVGSFWHFVICCICVFVCLCICVFVFGLGRSLLDQFGQKNASPLSSTFWFESSKPSYLFKSVLLLQPYSIWVGGLAPVLPRCAPMRENNEKLMGLLIAREMPYIAFAMPYLAFLGNSGSRAGPIRPFQTK